LLKLITNNRLAPAAQTEEHELFTVFRLAFNAKATRGNALFQQLATFQTKRGETYRRMVQRGEDFLSFTIETRASQHFNHFYTDSSQIINIQQSIWGLVGPFVRFMWNQLLYICNDLPVPQLQGTITDEYRTQLVGVINSSTPDTYVSAVLLDTLVALADDAFNEHFSGEFIYLGKKNTEYWESYDGYAHEVVRGFDEAVAESKRAEPG
jgi:hypothetical protein